jgi:hypothetical protein
MADKTDAPATCGARKEMEPLPLPLRRLRRLCTKTDIGAAAATQSNRILEHALQLCHCCISNEFLFHFDLSVCAISTSCVL